MSRASDIINHSRLIIFHVQIAHYFARGLATYGTTT